MDDTIKMIISSYEGGISNYKKILGEDNPKVIKACKCLETLKNHGESSNDMMDFSGKASASLSEMSGLFGELQNEKPVHKVVPEVPTSEKVAVGYHIAYNSIPKENTPETCKVYERVFELEKQAENGIQFMRMITEEGLTVKMSSLGTMEISSNLLNGDLKKQSLPQMMIYHQNMIREMENAKSVAEIDYYSNVRADLSYYENQWDTLFLIMVYVNLSSAITSYILSQTEENRQGVEYSYRFLAKYFSLNYDELMALPRIRDYFDKMIWATVKENFSSKGIDTQEKYLEVEKQYLMACLQGKAAVEFGSKERNILTFFGKNYHMHTDVPALYEKAPHPDDR